MVFPWVRYSLSEFINWVDQRPSAKYVLIDPPEGARHGWESYRDFVPRHPVRLSLRQSFRHGHPYPEIA